MNGGPAPAPAAAETINQPSLLEQLGADVRRRLVPASARDRVHVDHGARRQLEHAIARGIGLIVRQHRCRELRHLRREIVRFARINGDVVV